jgi:hypothetical protein
MLSGRADAQDYIVTAAAQFLNDWSHLDGLWPGADDGQYLHRHAVRHEIVTFASWG